MNVKNVKVTREIKDVVMSGYMRSLNVSLKSVEAIHQDKALKCILSEIKAFYTLIEKLDIPSDSLNEWVNKSKAFKAIDSITLALSQGYLHISLDKSYIVPDYSMSCLTWYDKKDFDSVVRERIKVDCIKKETAMMLESVSTTKQLNENFPHLVTYLPEWLKICKEN